METGTFSYLSTVRCKESARDWQMKLRCAPSSKSMLADDTKSVDGDRTEATAVFRSTSVELVDVCTSTTADTLADVEAGPGVC